MTIFELALFQTILFQAEGGAYVSSFLYLYRSIFPNPPGKNPLDGGAPFYDTYETKDGKYIAVGALEPQFYANLLRGMCVLIFEYCTNNIIRLSKQVRGILALSY